jgi:hypothetical protein
MIVLKTYKNRKFVIICKKHEALTKAVRNLGNILILKFLALNKICGKLKINHFEIPKCA